MQVIWRGTIALYVEQIEFKLWSMHIHQGLQNRIVFSSRATKMYHCPARRATLNTGLLQVLKTLNLIKLKA